MHGWVWNPKLYCKWVELTHKDDIFGEFTRKIFYWDKWLIFILLRITTVQDTAYNSIDNCFELVWTFHFPRTSFLAIAPFEWEKRNIMGLEIWIPIAESWVLCRKCKIKCLGFFPNWSVEKLSLISVKPYLGFKFKLKPRYHFSERCLKLLVPIYLFPLNIIDVILNSFSFFISALR